MTYKKQHYLPQLYLRGFLEEPNKYLFEFNKINGKVNKRALKNICQELDLYTLNLYDNREENLIIEKKILNSIEINFSKTLNLLKNKDFSFSKIDKEILSFHPLCILNNFGF